MWVLCNTIHSRYSSSWLLFPIDGHTVFMHRYPIHVILDLIWTIKWWKNGFSKYSVLLSMLSDVELLLNFNSFEVLWEFRVFASESHICVLFGQKVVQVCIELPIFALKRIFLYNIDECYDRSDNWEKYFRGIGQREVFPIWMSALIMIKPFGKCFWE